MKIVENALFQTRFCITEIHNLIGIYCKQLQCIFSKYLISILYTGHYATYCQYND